MDDPIKAAPTARLDGKLSGMQNILSDALYEMGYDDTLVDILIQRNLIAFDFVNDTSHIIDQLEEHYGESVLYGGLENAITFEGLSASLRGELGSVWRASKGDVFFKRVRHIIADPIEKLGMKAVTRHELENSSPFSEELESVKRHLTIDYGEFNSYLPNVHLVIYNPANFRVIAVTLCAVNLRNRVIEAAYWKRKLQTDGNRASIQFYLITADIGKTLQIANVPTKERVIAEVELDGTYVLTAEELEESDKVKLFEHFIPDLKRVIERR